MSLKQVFHAGFNKGKDGPGGSATRDMQTVKAKGGAKETVQGRMIHNANKSLTAENMRKPFG